MPTGTIQTIVSAAGLSVNSTISRTGTGAESHQVTLAAAVQSTGFTKTDANTGTATVAAGHGISNGASVAVKWSGGVRYGMAAWTSGDTTIVLEGGAGDDLPASDTTITIAPTTQLDLDLDGDNLELLVVHSTRAGHAHFRTTDTSGAGGSVKAIELYASEAWQWTDDSGITNPFTGDAMTAVDVANFNTSNTATLSIVAIFNSSS